VLDVRPLAVMLMIFLVSTTIELGKVEYSISYSLNQYIFIAETACTHWKEIVKCRVCIGFTVNIIVCG